MDKQENLPTFLTKIKTTKRKALVELSSNFAKVHYKNFKNLFQYATVMDELFTNISFSKEDILTKTGMEYVIKISTCSKEKNKHIENVFNQKNINITTISRDLLFCNTILSYIFATNILDQFDGIFDYRNDNKMIAVSWTHSCEGVRGKNISLKILLKNINFHIKQPVDVERFSLEWCTKMIETPIVEYEFYRTKFSLTKNATELTIGETVIPLAIYKPQDIKCFQSFTVWKFLHWLEKHIDDKSGNFKSTDMTSGNEKEFWYY